MANKDQPVYTQKKKQLSEQLAAGKVCPGYLICGDEDYLRIQERNALLEHFGVKEGDMNFSRFSGKGILAADVIETAMTMPFFADRRVILVEDSGWFAAKKRASAAEDAGESSGQEQSAADAQDGEKEQAAGNAEGKTMAAYFKEPCPTACIIFYERDVNRTTSLFRAIDKTGFVLVCDPQKEEVLRRWAKSRFKENGLTVEDAAIDRLLVRMTGGVSNDPRVDMFMMSGEMEKLVSYCHGRSAVTVQDVETVCSDILMDRVFVMVDQLAARDLQGSMRTYQEMLSLKQAPLRILALINREFNGMLQALELAQAHVGRKEIAERLSVLEFIVGKYLGWCRNYTHEQLRQILRACADTETAIKRGRMQDVVALEVLITQVTGI